MAVVAGLRRVACIVVVPHEQVFHREVHTQFAHIAILWQRHIVAQGDVLQLDEVTAIEETAAGIGVGQTDEARSLAITRLLLRKPHVLVLTESIVGIARRGTDRRVVCTTTAAEYLASCLCCDEERQIEVPPREFVGQAIHELRAWTAHMGTVVVVNDAVGHTVRTADVAVFCAANDRGLTVRRVGQVFSIHVNANGIIQVVFANGVSHFNDLHVATPGIVSRVIAQALHLVLHIRHIQNGGPFQRTCQVVAAQFQFHAVGAYVAGVDIVLLVAHHAGDALIEEHVGDGLLVDVHG